MEWPALEKAFTGSTHRSRAPRDTLAAFEPLMPRLGITRLANITGLDCIGIPVVVAIRPGSRGLAIAQGKGIDLASARASALMEAIETWHAERIEHVVRVDTVEALRLEGSSIDVARLQRRAQRNVARGRPIVWTRAHELISGSERWVPWEAVSCDFSSAVVRDAIFAMSTNGLASGNHVLEAINHALCEVIERDAITLLDQAGRAAKRERQIDLSTIDDPLSRDVLERFEKAGVDVVVWDATSDIGVPVLSAVIADKPSAARWQPRGPFRGYGCHPAREIALLRALTEAAQSRLTYISGSRDDLFPERFQELQRLEAGRVHGEDLAARGSRSFTSIRGSENGTFNDDLRDLLAALRTRGISEVAVFDMTRSELGVPVVKALVPGLENNIHRDRGYRPGPRALAAREARRS